ncbi:MAG: hypothetical protein P8182_05880 [Deltaproteobacteria bacterium]
MKQIQPGDQVLGMGMDGETIEVYRVVKVAADGIQVEETSGKLSKAGLRVHDADIFRQIQEKDRQVKALKQEIRKLYESLDPIG